MTDLQVMLNILNESNADYDFDKENNSLLIRNCNGRGYALLIVFDETGFPISVE